MARYRFGEFELDTQEWRLTQGDALIEVQQKVLDLLAALIERPDGLWTREALHARLWPDVFVGEAALFQLVRKARQALGDDAREPRFIATVPNRGYRFITPLVDATAAAVVEDAATGPAAVVVPVPAVELPGLSHQIPSERDAFVGRAADLADLQQRLREQAALVTVVGEGGIGKTRLATRLGWSMLPHLPGGVWFVGLAEVRDAQGILLAVARVLDVPLGSQGAVQLGHALASLGPALLVLDNAEQIVEPMREVVGVWLAGAPQLRVLVTSRTVLSLPAEQVLALQPLAAADAMALFVVRAAAQGEVSLTDAHADAMAQLVALLDGLPLALELAAARTRAWSPEILLARMTDRFRLLARMGPGGRQTTLWSTFSWGWELLEPWAQAALIDTSVFEGGFTLEAAEAVLALPASAPWPMDAVQALVDRSWLRPLDGDRFGMLLSVQEFCRGQATAAVRAEAERRHGQWAARLPHARQELDNVRAACVRAVTRGDADVTDACLLLAWGVLDLQGPTRAALELVEAALARFQPPSLRMLEVGARVYHSVGQLETALALAVQGQARVDAQPDLAAMRGVFPHLRGSIIDDLGGNSAQARECLQRALREVREIRNTANEAVVLGDLAIVYARSAELPVAREHFGAALVLHRAAKDRLAEGRTLANLGLVATHLGQLDVAEQHFREALAAHQEMGNRRAAGIVYNNQALLLGKQGRIPEALESYTQALRVLRAVGARTIEGNVLAGLGSLLLLHGDAAEARQHLAAALDIHLAAHNRASTGIVRGRLAQLHHQQGDIAAARRLYTEALADLDASGDLANLALFSARLGLLLAETSDPEGAAHHSRSARTHAHTIGDPELEVLVAALHAETTAVLGDPQAATTLLAALHDSTVAADSEPAIAIQAARRRLVRLPSGSTPPARASAEPT